MAALETAAKEAIVLKCELSCSRDKFAFRCGRADEEFERMRMVDARHGASGEKVLVGVFPGLFVEKDGKLEAMSKAVVRTM